MAAGRRMLSKDRSRSLVPGKAYCPSAGTSWHISHATGALWSARSAWHTVHTLRDQALTPSIASPWQTVHP